MDIKDFKFNISPEEMCQNLLKLSGMFKIHDGPMGMCIGTAIDPREFNKEVLKDILRIVDQVILPKAQEMLRDTERVSIGTMSEIVTLAFSDTISSIREIYEIPTQEIPILSIFGTPSR